MADEREGVAMTLGHLVNMELHDYMIVQMTEVYEVNDDGERRRSLGFFQNAAVAEAVKERDSYRAMAPVLVLTDRKGKNAFVLRDFGTITLLDEQQVAADLKQEIVNDLRPGARKLLGI